MGTDRAMEAYTRRDTISWWAGVRYVKPQLGDSPYISEDSTITGWGARRRARRMLRSFRRRQARGTLYIEKKVV